MSRTSAIEVAIATKDIERLHRLAATAHTPQQRIWLKLVSDMLYCQLRPQLQRRVAKPEPRQRTRQASD